MPAGHKYVYLNCGKTAKTDHNLKMYYLPLDTNRREKWIVNSDMKSLIVWFRPICCTVLQNFNRPLLTPQVFPQQRANMTQILKTKRHVAICQFTATNVKEDNYKTCERLVESAAGQGAKIVFLPEGLDFIAENKQETLALAEPPNGPTVKKYMKLAKKCNVWLSLGGIHVKESEETIRNTHLIINNEGVVLASYDKIHLFDINIPERKICLKESDLIKKGEEVVPPVPSPVGKIGLAICYDLRFPELSLLYRKMGAHILTFPSAFTTHTGAMHWEILLRCRAIENQCYVIAAAQVGRHNNNRSSWGHAMVVDPLGNIVTQCSNGTGFAMASINITHLDNTRLTMPVHLHRRCDLYPEMLPVPNKAQSTKSSSERLHSVLTQDYYDFGQVRVPRKAIFYITEYTMAFTNKRCVVPGHVLVAPLRVVPRLCEMTEIEVSDLFNTVKQVQNIVEGAHKAASSTITLQDGVDAGQTIQHVHVHVLPRKAGDFLQHDQVYYELQRHDKEAEKTQYWRSEGEMEQEATSLKQFIMPSNRKRIPIILENENEEK